MVVNNEQLQRRLGADQNRVKTQAWRQAGAGENPKKKNEQF